MPPPAEDARAGRPVEGLEERVDGIAAWINDLDTRVRAAELSAGDEKTARELRRAIEALSKHDPKLEKRLTNRVDVLADRLATLASTVSTTAAALARKDGEIASLRKELDEDTKRVEALARDRDKDGSAAEIEKLRSAIRAVQAERPGRTSDARVDGLGTKIDYLTERVDTLGKTVATTAAGLVGREGEIATLRQRLEERSAEIERTASEVRRLQGDSGLTQRLDALQATVDATATGLATRESDAGALKARIDEAYSRVGTAVTDLQGSIATLSSQVQALESLPGATEEVIAAQAEELDERFDAIQTRVDELATNVAAALGGLEDRARDTTALAQRVDEASGRVDEVVTELRQALGQLPAPGTVDPEVERRLVELAASVAAALDGLAAVETSSSARAEDVATRTAAVEQLVAAAGERLGAVERDRDAAAETLSQASAAWAEGQEWVRGRLDALASAQARAERSHETVGPLLDEARARLDTLDGAHAAAAAEIVRVSAALEAERAAVLNRVEALAATLAQTAEASSTGAEGIERALGDLGARVQSVEVRGASSESEIARVSAELEAERLSLRAELETLAALVAKAEPSNTGGEGIERALGELGARLLIVEERGTLSSSEIARVSAALDAERAVLHAQLDTLAASVADPGSSNVGGEGSDEMLDDLVARLRAVEEGRAATASEIARTAALWASELEAVEKRLTQGSRAADGTAVASNPETDRLVAELSGRLDELERERQAMVAELARVHTWEAERAALVARLDGMAASLAEVESGEGAQTPDAVGHEVVQLRVAVDGMRMRLASNEQELATVVGTRDTATRLDEVTRRLEALERAPVVIAGGADGGPAAGDGRFRLELRALELRMEHAEAAARENREAVLVQLERLAARIEWRFQRLESEYEAGQPEAIGGGGQVVPIRPTDTQQ